MDRQGFESLRGGSARLPPSFLNPPLVIWTKIDYNGFSWSVCLYKNLKIFHNNGTLLRETMEPWNLTAGHGTKMKNYIETLKEVPGLKRTKGCNLFYHWETQIIKQKVRNQFN